MGFPEIEGTSGAATLWGLIMGPLTVNHETKIVWRMTGSGPLSLTAVDPTGGRHQPTWGPVSHGESSNYDRPGEEWGAGYTFATAGIAGQGGTGRADLYPQSPTKGCHLTHRLPSSVPVEALKLTGPREYVPAEGVEARHSSRELLDEFDSLDERWLHRHDDAALDDVDAFLTTHGPIGDPAAAAHDVAVYLCNWVVANNPAARWVFEGPTCFVELGHNQLDPYRTVAQCITDHQPIAHRFVQHVMTMGDGSPQRR